MAQQRQFLKEQKDDNSQFTSNIFGQEISFEIAPAAVIFAIVFLRIAMGWVLFQGGLTKLLDPTWTAAGFLNNAIPQGNPLMGFFSSMAGAPLIDILVQWGLTLTGLGLLLGAFVRWNAFWGAFMMLMFWLASLEGGLAQGLPLANGWVVDDHMIYIFLLFGLGALGAGRVLGIDEWLEQTAFVQWLKYLLG